MDDHLIGILSNMGMISFIALSAYLILIVGEISFGQQAFFAISAYASGIASAMWGWPFLPSLIWGASISGLAGLIVAIPTLRVRGLYFAIATLAFAEMVRLVFEIFTYQVEIEGELVGPNGSEGFRDIRYIYEADISNFEYMLIIFALLVPTLTVILLVERSRLGTILRMIGEDPVLARLQGIDINRFKIATVAAAGLVAGIGGALYAHLNTYVEPKIFNVMLGVHGLAYGLIGGLGTAIGPTDRCCAGHRYPGVPARVFRLSHDRLRRPGGGAADLPAARNPGRSGGETDQTDPEASATMLELEDVTVRFGGVTALSSVSLKIGAGRRPSA